MSGVARLETRLRILAALLLIPLLMLGVVSGAALYLEAGASATYEQVQSQTATLDDLSAGLNSVLQDGSAFLATHDAVQQSFMRLDVQRVAAGFNALQTGPLTPIEKETVAAAAEAWAASLVAAGDIEALAPDTPTSAGAATRLLFALKQYLSDASQSVIALRVENEDQLKVLAQERQDRGRLSAIAVVLALVLGGLAALALSRRFALTMIRPLASLVVAADRIAQGDSEHRIGVGGPREVQHLQRAFNTMAGRLEEKDSAVREREARLVALVENAADGILVVAPDGEVTFVTPRMRDLVGQTHRHVDTGLIHPDDVERVRKAWARIITGGEGESAEVEARLAVAAGGWKHVLARLTNHIDDVAVGGVIFNVTDVSERHEYEQKLTYMALHDALTGLANRRLFLERLELAMRKGRQGAPDVSVAYIDFDEFKQINDSLGHQAGDRFLIEMGSRLSTCVRPSDLVARLGGDEFAILLDETSVRDAVSAAQRVLAALGKTWEVEGKDVRPRASVGVATGGAGGVGAETLLADADLAMYFAKRRGKGRFEVFTAPMRDELLERLRLGEDLKAAVETGALEVRYQPIVELRTGKVIGVEALARWSHPAQGWVPPATFIALAEEVGVIERIDFWMLSRACRQSAIWKAAGLPEIRVAVNISGHTLERPELIGLVEAALEESGMSPGNLELELTEGAAIDESPVARAAMEHLRDIGVRLAIDDFGTGYSALGRLRSLPFDRLKVDKVFIDELTGNRAGATLVGSILEMARVLHLEVVAEGVESQDQADFLMRNDCELGQGYLFSEPLGPDAVAEILSGQVQAIPSS